MDFIPLKRTSSLPQEKIRLYDSPTGVYRTYDIEGTVKLSSTGYLEKIDLFIDNESNNNRELTSAIICCKVISNNSEFYYAVINMKHSAKPTHKTVQIVPTVPCKVKINSGTLIYFHINEYDEDKNEILDCSKIKIFGSSLTPEHKNGNILVGNP